MKAETRPTFIGEREVLLRIPVSRSTWRRLYMNDEAPRPVKVGGRRLWSLAEIERFEQRLLADRG
jgi:predicted DNA-binding transcriptional regulator AlpA